MEPKSKKPFSDSLTDFSDKVLFKTILYSLSDADARSFLTLLENNNFDEAEKLIAEKIPDLDEKVDDETHKRLKNIFKKLLYA